MGRGGVGSGLHSARDVFLEHAEKAAHLGHLADVLWPQIAVVREAGGLATWPFKPTHSWRRITMLGGLGRMEACQREAVDEAVSVPTKRLLGCGHVPGLHAMLPCRNCMHPLCQGGKETS